MSADCAECRSVPCPPNDVRGRTIAQRVSVSSRLVPPAEGGGGYSTSNSDRLPPSEQPLDVQPHYPRQPPPHSDPVSGYPSYQQTPPCKGHGPGQPPLHPFDMNGQSLNPPPPPQYIVPHLGHSVPVFGRLQDPMGQVIGLVHRGSFTVPGCTGAGPSVRQLPPGYPHVPPQMYPQMQPPVHPQMPPQMNPQMPPQVYPQMPPQMQMRGPMPMNWDGPPGPPPPYPGQVFAPGEATVGTNRAGPSTTGRRTSRTSGTRAPSQPRGSGLDLNEGQGGDDGGLDVPPISRREATGRASTRANPSRRARPTQLRESD